MRRVLVSMLVAAVVTACTSGGSSGTSVPVDREDEAAGAASPELAVSEMFRLLGRDDTGDILSLTVPDQMVVVALVEGVSVDDALLLETTGVDIVVRNFWQGFRSSLLEALAAETIDLRIGDVDEFAVDGVSFARIQVLFPLDGSVRTFFVRNDGVGWKVDVIATFAPALVPKIPEVSAAVRRHADAGSLEDLLADLEPSLWAVQQRSDLDPAISQAVLAALEEIRR